MTRSLTRQQETAELEAVFASGTFAKSQNLARLLKYLCRKYFEGQASELKEFNIGVEALGRLADFDPTSNSIVRVELHRLRERLKKYYDTEGLHDPVVIVLKPGNYTPQFLSRSEFEAQFAPQTLAPPNGATEVSDVGPKSLRPGPQIVAPPNGVMEELGANGAEPSPEAESVPKQVAPLRKRFQAWLANWRSRGLAWFFVPTVAFLVLVTVAVLIAWKSKLVSFQVPSLAAPRAKNREVLPGADSGREIRILAGYSRSNYTDHTGLIWGPDRYYSGGATRSAAPQFIDRTRDATLYQSCREGEFNYDIPLPPGLYELGLYFAETIYGQNTLAGGGEGSRTFNVDLNGKPILTEFDPLSDAGASGTADKRVFVDVSPAADGKLHLRFYKFVGPTPPQDEAILNALEIVPGIPGKMRPIRIVAQTNSYTDHSGRVWGPDVYASQGRLALHNRPVEQTADSGLYYGEHYGHFSYAIPVATGRQYGLTLHFAETYFGPENPGHGGAGSRVFDVYCNGVALLRNFDIFKEAGGANRALEKTFHGLPASAMGKLLLSFVPVKNYACVNAIEVVDESK
jgi:hypothetical protein